MLTAKAAVLTGLVLLAGTAGVLASVLAARLILPGHGYPVLSLANGADLRAAAGSVLYLALIGLLALGTATAVRDSAASIGVVLGLLYLFPVVASAVGPDWSRHLQQIGPMSAGLDIQATTGLRSLPLSPWAGLGVLTACQHCSEPQSWPTRCTGWSGLTARMTASRSAMSSGKA